MAENGEDVALKALLWLLNNDELLPVFMGATGVGGADMRAGAGDPVFLASVLDFLMMNDTWVVDFCQHHGLAYEAPMRARQNLPGGGEVHWT